jgi:histidyl-tRNA synthetase
LEYQEVLLGKYGKEAEKLMYLFKDPGGRGVGLRYDLTVPLARVIASYRDLPKPFKRYQIQPVWRAEKPQKGRYREFYQCDVDIVGSPSPLADAEIIAIISDVLKALDFSDFKIRVNSRSVLFSSMEAAGISRSKWNTTIQSIDKLDKKPKEEVAKELIEKGFKNEQIKNIFKIITKAKPDDFLSKAINYAKKMGAKNIEFDPILARGLDYYTGPVFESIVKKPKIGSITGGGRYDKLLKDLGGPDLSATGTTIGLDRVADVIEELNLWPNLPKTKTQVLVTVFSPDLLSQSVKVADSLRENNIQVELYLDENTKLDKQLKYADKKGIPFAVIIGPEEAKNNKVTLKDLKSRTQELISAEELIEKIK